MNASYVWKQDFWVKGKCIVLLDIAKYPSTESEKILHSHQQCLSATSPAALPTNVCLSFWIFANLIGLKCYLSVISICISLKNKSEQFFNILSPFLSLSYLFISFERQTLKNKNLPISELCIKWNLALEDPGSSPNSPYCGALDKLLNLSSLSLSIKLNTTPTQSYIANCRLQM